MAGVNKVILIGNLGKDPELKYTPSGSAVATFSLATTERWADKSGQRQDRTEWHNIVAWGKLAELCNQYLKKGRSAYIEGRISTRSWDDKDGNKKYKTEIVALTVQFLGGPGNAGSVSGSENEMPSEQQAPSYDAPSSVSERGAAIEEDLPF